MMRQNRVPTSSPIHLKIQQAPEPIAASLWVPLGTEVISRYEKRLIDGTPWSMQTSYYPMAFADRGAPRVSGAPRTSRK